MPVLEFNDVRYEANGLSILKGVSGYAQSGKLLAIMGSSGAGKTTLLDILAHKQMEGTVTGSITLDGSKLSQRKFKKMAGYVNQEDMLLNTATVRETLMFAIKLRCGHLSLQEQTARVNKVMEELGIAHRADAFVGGGNVRGLSGGEKRRVSVALELVTDCSILFLDEPTSGLDSNTAESVMQCLVDIAAKGRMVICTIHQPNSDITAKFDDFMLLSGGRVVYSGPWSAAVERFAEAGYQCPMYSNPTDYFIKIAADESKADELALAQLSWWKAHGESMKADRVEEDRRLTRMLSMEENAAAQPQPVGFFGTTKVITERFVNQWLRDQDMFASEVSQYLFYGTFMGLLYLQVNDEAEEGGYNRTAGIFFLMTMLCFTPGMTVITVFENERKLVAREHSNGMYSLPAYYLAKTLVSWPVEMFLCLIVSCVSYFMIGLQADAGKFFTFVGVLIVFQLICETVGLLCASAAPNAMYGILLVSAVLLILLSTGGFMVADLPVYFAWIADINFFQYALLALLKNEMSGLELKAADGSKVPAEDTLGSDLTTDLTIPEIVGILFAYLVVFRLMAVLILMKQSAKKTWRDIFGDLCRCCGSHQQTPASSTRASTTNAQPGAELVPVEVNGSSDV